MSEINGLLNFFGERSEQIDQLVVALVAANANGLANVSKDAKNPHYGNRYATLAACVDAIGPALNKAGLAVFQLVTGPGRVKTVLAHTSGQYIAAEVELPPVKGDPQAAGSAITYARRYALPAIVGVATDEDDDGNAASNRAAPAKAEPPAEKGNGKKVPDKPTRDFMGAMFEVSTEFEKVLEVGGEQKPKAEVKERLTRLLGNEGYEHLEDVGAREAQEKVYRTWKAALEAARGFNGGAK